MITKSERQRERGYVLEGSELSYTYSSFKKRINLLKSTISTERTLGARLLKNNASSIQHLINALKNEKNIYTKIEICNSLISLGEISIKPVIEILGKIGNNQHKNIPEKEFKKDSYPLPRDIAARILIRIGKITLTELLKVLERDNKYQISEAIDAIGFVCFYDYQKNIYNELIKYYTKNIEPDLIKWKILRAMSSFPESIDFLNNEKKIIKNDRLVKEIERSLKLIIKRLQK